MRLNLAFALAVAQAGGCLVVDATKRGKVWCGVTGRLHFLTLSYAARHHHWTLQPHSLRPLIINIQKSPPLPSCPKPQRFPDAMSKTVPMWCAVMNRAVLLLRTAATAAAGAAPAGAGPGGQRGERAGEGEGEGGEGPEAGGAWDCDVHLPPWVSANERNSIRQLLEGWVDQLVQVRGWPAALWRSSGWKGCNEAPLGGWVGGG